MSRPWDRDTPPRPIMPSQTELAEVRIAGAHPAAVDQARREQAARLRLAPAGHRGRRVA